ncbi:MAG: hypothetical protein PWP45_1207 [Tepidanaerobacteraceae bacterium]|nr:hypothetical protein [Tepidanaerobacteraceae bacterium]
MTKNGNSEAAFTLAEVVVALSVFTLIVGAALSLYQQSVLTWKRDEMRFDVQEELKFALESMTRDIRSATEVIDTGTSELKLKVIPPGGNSNGLLNAKEVVYEWDSGKGELVKVFEGKREVLARKVTGFTVKYYDGQNVTAEPESVRRIEIAITAGAGLSSDNGSKITMTTSAAVRASR